MRKKEIFSFRGMNQDVTKSKHPKEFYYEGNNIRITAVDSQTTGSISNEKGTEVTLTIPKPLVEFSKKTISYNDKTLKFLTDELSDFEGKTSNKQIIIGHTIARDNIILFTTDSNGFDCVWELVKQTEEYDLNLLYIRNLGFNKETPIQSIFNFENDNIQKIYWVDGKSQLRFLNIRHSKASEGEEELINVAANTINIVGNFNIAQPKITSIVSGGNHTAGMIQYAYNLYRLNSSQTKLSPLSPLIPLDKGVGQGGGKVNEIVGSTPTIEINDIDKEYSHIKVYAVKYTSYNQLPTVSLIKDQEVPTSRRINIFDDGNVINDISLAEFRFLGTDPIIPKHIESKDNILFSSNIKEKAFDVDLDTRAFSYDNSSFIPTAEIYDNIKISKFTGKPFGGKLKLGKGYYSVPEKHDAVNLNYDKYRWQGEDNDKLGGEGKYLKYELIQDTNVKDPENKKFFKDNEIYRLGIHFYNRLGQKSLPKWIADFKAPEGNLEGKYNTLLVTLKPEFYVWLNTSSNFESEDDKPVGYKILRANRTQNDRTIISQGFLNGFMSNFRAQDKSNNFSDQSRYRTQEGNKLPSLQRVYGKHNSQMEGMKHGKTLGEFTARDNEREVHKASSSDYWVAETFQYNVLMQMFSPEAIFSSVPLYEGLNLRIKGALENKNNSFWGQERKISTKEIIRDGKVLNGLTPHESGEYSGFLGSILSRGNSDGEINITGNVNDLADKGIYGAANAEEDTSMDFFQFYRDFTNSFTASTNEVISPVYGKPELTVKGQGATNYNNDPNFKYYNSLQPMIADGGDSNKGENDDAPSITSVNSWGAQCITMVLGPDNKDYDPIDRPKLEELHKKTGIDKTNVMLVGELVKNQEQIYLGGIYGGNSYEDKKRTNYIEIGNYSKINDNILFIESGGDTYVQNFRFGKMLKTDNEVYTASSKQFSEIVEGLVESSVNLNNRSDISLTGWDSRFQPRYDEYHDYNRVYSQQPTLIESQDVDYNFRKIRNFDTRIMASKIKVPGENIDNWTDLLVNEVQDLNGQFGPINGLCSFRDEIYAYQDKAFAYVSINPRVQVQGSDGVQVELGSGKVLHDYKYISTNSGTLNKWSIQPTQYAIYYFDTINKSFNRYSNKVEKLSDIHGLHSWFQNNANYSLIKEDNPILGKGANVGYDNINNSVMLTLNQQNPKTLIFCEATNSFTSFMDYHPSRYIVNGSGLFSIQENDNTVHEHFKGDYNRFYGNKKSSYVTLLVNPASNYECIFDNIEYNGELYLDDLTLDDKTLTHIHAWNEYQDTGKIPLTIGRNNNLRRKFRTWRANIPRDGRSRMRNPWIYLKLELDNTENYKLILHDIIVNYTVN